MSEPPPAIRAFVAIYLPPELREVFRRVQEGLKSAGGDLVRWTPPDEIHLTLKFFESLDPGALQSLETALRQACEDVSSFSLRAEGLGGFPDLSQPRILWAGVQGDLAALDASHQSIERETDAWGGREEPEYHPHLTIGRLRERGASGLHKLLARMESLKELQFGKWEVPEICMMRSELSPGGARHTLLTRIELTPRKGGANPEN